MPPSAFARSSAIYKTEPLPMAPGLIANAYALAPDVVGKPGNTEITLPLVVGNPVPTVATLCTVPDAAEQ